MRRHPFYLLFGTLLILGASFIDLRGWTIARAVASRGGPRTVRANSGTSRVIYTGGSRFRRGK